MRISVHILHVSSLRTNSTMELSGRTFSYRECVVYGGRRGYRFIENIRTKVYCQDEKIRLRYSKRRRKAVYLWIKSLAERISIGLEKNVITSTAWRIAAKHWLIENGMIRMVKAGNVLPFFFFEFVS